MDSPSLGQKAVAELIGTFLFVFVGAGSAVGLQSLGAFSGPELLAVALANGLGLGIAISATMNVSGGHINPAVTMGMLVTRRISIAHAVVYILSQVVGATVAGYLLVSLLPSALGNAVHWGAPAISGISVTQATLLELIMTFLLVFTVFGTAVDSRAPKIGGFGVGLIVVADVMIGGPFTGAAMNPARAIGPMIAGAFYTSWYIYWIGPIIGGILAALIYHYVILKGVHEY